MNLRIGIVLSAQGGALATQLPAFKMGLGARLGAGKQGISWISQDDLVRAIHFLLHRSDLSGPVNATAPEPVSNAEFARELGRVLRRPVRLAIPAIVARLALGEMADEMLLGGVYVRPDVLEGAGFEFDHPDLESALRFQLGRSA